MEKEKNNIAILADSGLEIRYHMPFQRVELAHRNEDHARSSLQYFKDCFDFIYEVGGKYVVTHLCLGYRFALDKMKYENAVDFLKQAVEYAAEKGITVCLENLTYGFVNTPDAFLKFLSETGACATLDIGHVAASPIVTSGKLSSSDYIARMLPHIRSAHIYDIEKINEKTKRAFHVAPLSKDSILSRLRMLLKSENCNWWLIELGSSDEILRTTSFIHEIVNSNYDKKL